MMSQRVSKFLSNQSSVVQIPLLKATQRGSPNSHNRKFLKIKLNYNRLFVSKVGGVQQSGRMKY